MSDLLKQLKEDWKEAEEYWKKNAARWLEIQRFRNLEQWPEKIRKEREDAGRPVIVSDKTEQYVRQVVNDGRQNRPSPKASPVDDKGDVKVADAIKGLVRSICKSSNADEAFDTALDHAAGNGFGFFRLITLYEGEHTFNQEIAVRRVRNPLAVKVSPHELADGSDCRYGFVEDKVRKDDYKRKWPKAKVVNFTEGGWSDENYVRIVEYFYKVEEQEPLFLLSDGTSCTAKEYEADIRPVMPQEPEEGVDYKPDVVDQRMVSVPRVKWCRASGAEILEEKDWAGKYIPIIPVYGVERDINGEVVYDGLVRPAMDEQRMYNFGRAGFAEHVSLSTKQPYIAAAGQLEGFEDDWNEAHVKNIPVLHYNPVSLDGQTALPAPFKAQPSTIPAILAQDMQVSEHGIQGAMGMYNASVGERSNEKSGVAIRARDRQSDVGTFHYHDNLNRAIRYLGRQLGDLMPKIYDSKRVKRILGEDGKASLITIDPRLGKPHEKRGSESIYNLGIGVYDVDFEAGPSYTTKKQEAADGMMEMARAAPQMWQTHGDLIAETQDWPGADRFARRSKLLLPPEIQEAEEEGEEDPEIRAVVSRARQAIAMREEKIAAAEQGIAERDQALEQAKRQIDDLKTQISSKAADAAAKLQDADTREYAAKTDRMQALAPAVTPDLIVQIVQKTVAEIMAQPAPSGPPMKPPTPPLVAAPTDDEPPPGGFFTP